MTTITLHRRALWDDVTCGEMVLSDGRKLYTLERPWLDNKPFVSCIPAGVYNCKRYSSTKYPDTFEVAGVPGRTSILFHAANYVNELQGCIALGRHRGNAKKVPSVTDSRIALYWFAECLSGIDTFTLKITNINDE